MNNFPGWPRNPALPLSNPTSLAEPRGEGASQWFDAAPQGLSIVGDLPQDARGLSVEQHTERVLEHLLGERGREH